MSDFVESYLNNCEESTSCDAVNTLLVINNIFKYAWVTDTSDVREFLSNYDNIIVHETECEGILIINKESNVSLKQVYDWERETLLSIVLELRGNITAELTFNRYSTNIPNHMLGKQIVQLFE